MAAYIDNCQVITSMVWDSDGKRFLPVLSEDHESCSGGQTMPGVLGGWRCSCPCHRAPLNPGSE